VGEGGHVILTLRKGLLCLFVFVLILKLLYGLNGYLTAIKLKATSW